MKIKVFKLDDNTLLISLIDGEIIVRGNYGEGCSVELPDKESTRLNSQDEFSEKELES